VRDAVREEADAQRAARPWRQVVRGRAAWLVVLLVLWVGAVIARLADLQIRQHDALVAYGERQLADAEVLPGLRGRVLDRNGHTLAVTVQGDVVVADPQVISDPAQKRDVGEIANRICGAIAECGSADRTRIADTLTSRSRSRYAVLWKEASPADARRVEALDIKGVTIEQQPRRFYPNRSLAAHVVGYVDVKQRGLAGVELSQDSTIRGKDGRRLVLRDGKRHGYDSHDQPATMGASVELTIDRSLQLIVERELAAGAREFGAAGVLAVVMDPWTGEILAAGSTPTFNPNAFTKETVPFQRNRAVQDLYEPGSTFKIVTASAALDTGAHTPESTINVTGGMIRIGARVINDDHYYGDLLTLRNIIVKSSNVGAIRIGLGLGAPVVGEYARLFGFGWLRVRDLPFSPRGAILGPDDPWSQSALASVSFGYQVGVSPVQMAAMVSAVANGGTLYEPHVVRAVITGSGRRATPIKALHRVISAETAATMTAILEGVVEEGTARAARLPGYTVAGKTGTARKVAEGRRGYSDRYNASFVGFVPSRNPVYSIVVVVDSPRGKGYYGGVVAAPIFKRIAQAALSLGGVPANVDPARTEHVLVTRRETRDGVVGTGGVAMPTPTSTVATASIDDVPPGTMPDLRNLGAREALRRLTRSGVAVRMHGTGVVVEQDVPPGRPVGPGVVCTLTLEPRPRPGDTGAEP
jgi:cell division protein FtsI/penicillin-binding protein 2